MACSSTIARVWVLMLLFGCLPWVEPAATTSVVHNPPGPTVLQRRLPPTAVRLDETLTFQVLDLDPDLPNALVYVHGDAGTFDYFAPQVAHFRGRYRQVLYEREDCGQTRCLGCRIGYAASAHNLRRLLHQLGIGAHVVLGHSRGQELGAVYFSLRPEGLRGFIASGTAVLVEPSTSAKREAEELLRCHRAGALDLNRQCLDDLEPKVVALHQGLGCSVEEAREMVRYACSSWRPNAGILGGLDVSIGEQLASIEVPMLQLDGAAYRREIDRREAMTRHYRHGRLVLFPGAGHVPHLEQPVAFNRAVEEFLDEIGFAPAARW